MVAFDTNRRLLTALAAMSLLPLTLLLPFLTPAANAYLPACGTQQHSWVGGTWTPATGNPAAGVEGPVQLRTGTIVCWDATGGYGGSASAWISIQGEDPTTGDGEIVQAGWYVQAISNTTMDECSFWAAGDGDGQPHVITCNGDTGGTFRWFRISIYADASGEYYKVYDCGEGGGYGSCSQVAVTTGVWGGTPIGGFMGEAAFACTDQMTGGSSNRTGNGTSAYPLMEQNAVGGTWASHGLSNPNHGVDCGSDYQSTASSLLVQTWDSRN